MRHSGLSSEFSLPRRKDITPQPIGFGSDVMLGVVNRALTGSNTGLLRTFKDWRHDAIPSDNLVTVSSPTVVSRVPMGGGPGLKEVGMVDAIDALIGDRRSKALRKGRLVGRLGQVTVVGETPTVELTDPGILVMTSRNAGQVVSVGHRRDRPEVYIPITKGATFTPVSQILHTGKPAGFQAPRLPR